jgi:hypothetical protein
MQRRLGKDGGDDRRQHQHQRKNRARRADQPPAAPARHSLRHAMRNHRENQRHQSHLQRAHPQLAQRQEGLQPCAQGEIIVVSQDKTKQ